MRVSRVIATVVAVGSLALALSGADHLLAPPVSAAEPAPSSVLCTITDPRIVEASGLAATEEALYVVNDGGTSVQVFVLDHRCQVIDVLTAGIDPFDVEDLALDRHGRLWLSDTGDNDHQRETVAFEVLDPVGGTSLYRLTYPDGAENAEALLLSGSGQPFVVTKDPLGTSVVYTTDGPLTSPGPTPLREVATVDLELTGTGGGPAGTLSQWMVTGGAVSVDGRRVALRTYTDLYLWFAPEGDVAAALRDGEPTVIPLPSEAQGETVAFTADGGAVYTVSEGSPVPVHVTSIPAVDPPEEPAAEGGGGSAASEDGGTGTDEEDESSLGTLVLAAVAAAAVLMLLGRTRRRS